MQSHIIIHKLGERDVELNSRPRNGDSVSYPLSHCPQFIGFTIWVKMKLACLDTETQGSMGPSYQTGGGSGTRGTAGLGLQRTEMLGLFIIKPL